MAFTDAEISAVMLQETRRKFPLAIVFETGKTADDGLTVHGATTKITSNKRRGQRGIEKHLDYIYKTKLTLVLPLGESKIRRKALTMQLRKAWESALAATSNLCRVRQDGTVNIYRPRKHPAWKTAIAKFSKSRRRILNARLERQRREQKERAKKLMKMRRGRVVPTCHPDKKHYAKGMCWNCYKKHLRKKETP